MMKNNEGSASSRLLALILAGALVLTAGVTAFADEGNESSDMKSDNVEIIETDAQFAEEDLIALDGELPPPDAEIEPQPEDVYDDGTEGLVEEFPVQEEETPEIDVVEPSEETTPPEDGEPGDEETNQVESTDADEIDIVENPLYGDQDPPLPPEIETPEPPEPVLLDEEAIDTFFEECLRIAAPEIAAMDEEQLAMLEEAWMNNIFVYDPGDDILNAYMIEGIGDYTRLVIAIENVRACIDFVQENYQGDEEFIRAFHEAVVTGYSDIVRLETYDLLSEETKVSLFDAVFHCFSAVREIEDAEVESFGETLIMSLFDSYNNVRGAEDLTVFLERVSELAKADNNRFPQNAGQMNQEDAILPEESAVVLIPEEIATSPDEDKDKALIEDSGDPDDEKAD